MLSCFLGGTEPARSQQVKLDGFPSGFFFGEKFRSTQLSTCTSTRKNFIRSRLRRPTWASVYEVGYARVYVAGGVDLLSLFLLDL